MNANDLFSAPAQAPAAASGASSIPAASLFGGGDGKEEPATSSLSKSREVLPQASEKGAIASPSAAAPTPPTPQDVQRNAVDHASTARERGAGFLEHMSDERDTAEKMSAGFAMGELPGVTKGVKAAAKALGFGDKFAAAINGVTNKSAGVSVLQDINSKLGDPIQKISDSLYALSKSAQGLKMQWLVDVKNFKPKDWDQHAESIYHSFEDPSIKLTPRAQELKTKMIQPIMDKNAKMVDMLRILGVKVGDDIDQYVGRIPLGKSSLVDQLGSTIPQGQAKGISTFAPETQSRKVFGMEGAGEQDLHLVQAKNNNSYQVYRAGKVIGSGKLGADDLANKEVSFSGEKFKLTNSTTKAIEANTPLQYYHDPLLSAINGNINLNEALRNAQFLEQFKHSPEFKQLVVQPKADAPAGFREVSIPQLRGYKFSERVANVLDDYSGAGQGNSAMDKLGQITRVTVGSLFWNPLPHIANVLDHKMIEGGLVGNIKALTMDLPSTLKTAIAAHKEVMNMGPLYRQALKEGAGLIYPSVVTRNFAESMAKQLGTAPEMDAVAKAWGYANPLNMVKSIYQHSSKALWSWNDVIMMHSYMAHMAEGQGLKEAIGTAEKHIPNYRIPDQVAGSRMVAQMLKSSAVTAFGRYDYGRLASYGNMVKDLISRDSSIADRAHALDQMAMLATSSLVVYPALDALVRKVTGNDDAQIRRFGASSVPDAIYKFSTGDKNWGMLMSSVMPISPALKLPTELMSGTDTFSGKKIGVDETLSHYAASQFAPVGAAESVSSGRKTGQEVMLAQMGIVAPTKQELARRDKAKAGEAKRKAKTGGL
jgi:hypothetical protein